MNASLQEKVKKGNGSRETGLDNLHTHITEIMVIVMNPLHFEKD